MYIQLSLAHVLTHTQYKCSRHDVELIGILHTLGSWLIEHLYALSCCRCLRARLCCVVTQGYDCSFSLSLSLSPFLPPSLPPSLPLFSKCLLSPSLPLTLPFHPFSPRLPPSLPLSTFFLPSLLSSFTVLAGHVGISHSESWWSSRWGCGEVLRCSKLGSPGWASHHCPPPRLTGGVWLANDSRK